MKRELVKNWMSRDVISVELSTNLSKAHQLMLDHRIRRLPVIHRERLVGVVTLGDVRAALPSNTKTVSPFEANSLLLGVTVERIMTQNPVTVSPYATISEAAWLMMEYKISGLPVVDKSGKLVGIITESDIFRLVVDEWGRLNSDIFPNFRAMHS